MMADKRVDFLKDLFSLLEKYDVEIVSTDHWKGYPECGQDIRITAEFDDGETHDIEFDNYIYREKISNIIHDIKTLDR